MKDYILEPSIYESVNTTESEDIQSLEECDKMILENCGYDTSYGKGKMMFENVVADSTDKKIFTVDTYRSYNIEDARDEILKDEEFDRYLHQAIYDKLTDEDDGALLEQWTPTFIGEEVYRQLDTLSKQEIFNYVELFKSILSLSENEHAIELLDFDDDSFNKMPVVMRLF